MEQESLRSLFDFGMVVLIWLVQLVIYPGFKRYAKKNLMYWHKIYIHRIAYIVVPLMLGQLILSGWQLYGLLSVYSVGYFLTVIFLWVFTFSHFAPLHHKISKGRFDQDSLEKLTNRNWFRTILWTVIFIWGLFTDY